MKIEQYCKVFGWKTSLPDNNNNSSILYFNQNHHHNSLKKTFSFAKKIDMNQFVVELLGIYHEPGSENPHIEATEQLSCLSVCVSIELGTCQNEHSITTIMKKVEKAFTDTNS